MRDAIVLHLSEDFVVNEVSPGHWRRDDLAARQRRGDPLCELAGILGFWRLKKGSVDLREPVLRHRLNLRFPRLVIRRPNGGEDCGQEPGANDGELSHLLSLHGLG